MLVERVEGPAREDQREPEERRRDEARAEIGDGCRRRQPAGDERPPEEQPAGDQQGVLHVERPLAAQGPVVEAREVRAVPGGEPGEERVARPHVPSAVGIEPRPHRRREPQKHERRRDVCDQRVLEQMHEQKPLGRDRLERGVQ